MHALRCGRRQDRRQYLRRQLAGRGFNLFPRFGTLGLQSRLGRMHLLLGRQAGRRQSALPLGIPLPDAVLPRPEDLGPRRPQLRLIFLSPDIRLGDRQTRSFQCAGRPLPALRAYLLQPAVQDVTGTPTPAK